MAQKKKARRKSTSSSSSVKGKTRTKKVLSRSSKPDLDNIELLTVICNYFCKGYKAAEISELLKKQHQIIMSREVPYNYIADAAKKGWFQFHAPPEHALSERVEQSYRWLKRARVVHTAMFEDVASHTAHVLIDLLQTRAQPPYSNECAHVGFAGGNAMRHVAQIFAGLLHQPDQALPETIVFHTLVAGFDVKDPTTNPNAFFIYLVDDSAMSVETEFVGLHAPPLVDSDQFETMKSSQGIKESFDQVKGYNLDIIVTSGGSWETPCPHSMLRNFMDGSKESMNTLKKESCCGDMLWRPLSARGPIIRKTKKRAMTLIELTDLPVYISKGTDVVLMLGPCRACGKPRPQLLRTILNLEEHLITHLVTDTRSAIALLEN